jgi:hypothetical protein
LLNPLVSNIPRLEEGLKWLKTSSNLDDVQSFILETKGLEDLVTVEGQELQQTLESLFPETATIDQLQANARVCFWVIWFWKTVGASETEADSLSSRDSSEPSPKSEATKTLPTVDSHIDEPKSKRPKVS